MRVNHNDDDAEERMSDGDVDPGSSDLELSYDGSDAQMVGIRFNNITIPQGATITNAYIEFETDETDSGSTTLTFHGQDSDNATRFTSSDDDISDRSLTSATFTWSNVPAWNSKNEKHQTPNLAALIQEIVNREGWQNGNSLVIIVAGSGKRVAKSHDEEASAAPLLHTINNMLKTNDTLVSNN